MVTLRGCKDSSCRIAKSSAALAQAIRKPPRMDSIIRDVIHNSKEVLHLLEEQNPAFKPVLAVI